MVMLKNIYIIPIKISLERLQLLTKLIESKKEYENIYSYTNADYIVTELKSPSRIMRNVRKSTCPIVHVTWLLESMRLQKTLDPQLYIIDVLEARKQAILSLSAEAAARALPRQLTWDQVALRRLDKTNFGNDSYLARHAGLQERSRFSRSYGSRNRSSKRNIYSISNKNNSTSRTSSLIHQEREINITSTDTITSVCTSNNFTDCVDNMNEENVGSDKETRIKNTTPTLLLNSDLCIKDIDNSKINLSLSNSLLASPPRCHSNNIIFENEEFKSIVTKEIIVIEDTSYNESCKEPIANELSNSYDQEFSIVCQSNLVNNNLSHSLIDTASHGLDGSSFNNNDNGSFDFNCSSISSIDFDPSQYSLSVILSL